MNIRYSISEKWPSKDIKLVMDALEFAIDYYNIFDVKATLTAKLITGHDEPCDATADRIKNKRFEIRLNYQILKGNEAELLKTIFHEMTHVKQFINDGLRFKQKRAMFQEESYTLEVADDYWFSPWEMEARAMETPLYNKFMEQN